MIVSDLVRCLIECAPNNVAPDETPHGLKDVFLDIDGVMYCTDIYEVDLDDEHIIVRLTSMQPQ